MGSALLLPTEELSIRFYLCEIWVCGMVPPTMNQCNYFCSWWDKNDRAEMHSVCDLLNDPVYLELSAAQQFCLPAAGVHDSALGGIESSVLCGFQLNPQIRWKKTAKICPNPQLKQWKYPTWCSHFWCRETLINSPENLQTSALLLKSVTFIYFEETSALSF